MAVASRTTRLDRIGARPPPGIRVAVVDDLAALAELEQRCFAGDRLSRRQYRRHLRNDRAWIALVSDAGRAIGSALVFFRADSRAARLYSIAIDPRARGRGLGGALLAAAERAARRRGAVAMRLEVRTDNAGAVALYTSRGYRRIGVRRRYYADGADALRFEKRLAPARASRMHSH